MICGPFLAIVCVGGASQISTSTESNPFPVEVEIKQPLKGPFLFPEVPRKAAQTGRLLYVQLFLAFSGGFKILVLEFIPKI